VTLKGSGFDTSSITAIGRLTGYDDNAQEARQPGNDWAAYPVIAGDDAFYRNAAMKLDARAEAYSTDRAVYDAVRSTAGLAVIDSSPFVNAGMSTAAPLTVNDVDPWSGSFKPFALEVRDKVTGASTTVTVIGMLSADIPDNLLIGIYTNESTYRPILGEPEYNTTFVRLAPGTDAERAAKSIKAALVTQGVQAISIQEQIDAAVSSSLGFVRVFQAFMALGLLVGIAALGVIALRSVVERRQQIGMLRAIGYQRSTVAVSFLLESGFIASMGILAGVVGAALLSWQLIAGGEMSDAEYYVPWAEIIVEVTLALVFALLMTWWPSRRAASVPVAEALRYE
jgi:putative ABC transport system permease protein